jgi:hypothetical protein
MIDAFHGRHRKKELPAKYIQFKRYDIDISKVPMMIYPAPLPERRILKRVGGTTVRAFTAPERSPEVHGRTGSWALASMCWSSEEGRSEAASM